MTGRNEKAPLDDEVTDDELDGVSGGARINKAQLMKKKKKLKTDAPIDTDDPPAQGSSPNK